MFLFPQQGSIKTTRYKRNILHSEGYPNIKNISSTVEDKTLIS
jgi:hypothetical protein